MEVADSWDEIGEHLRSARLALGVTQAQLGEQLGLDRTAVAKVESGTRKLDALELFRAADALGLSVGHLVRRPPAAVVSRRAARAEADTGSSRDEFRSEARLQSWLWDVRQLADLGVLRPRPPLRISGVDGEEAARSAAADVRRMIGVGTDALGAMVAVGEQCGVYILAAELPGEGASLAESDLAVAVVSSTIEPGRRRTTAAHELGHQVLGDEYSADLGVSTSRDDRERVVDAFAAELVLPLAAVRGRWPAAAEEVTCRAAAVQIAAEYRVSWSLLLRQVQHAGLLPAEWRHAWRTQTPTRAEFLASPEGPPRPDLSAGEVPPSYAAAVLSAYRRWDIGPHRAVEMLHGQVSEDELPVLDDGPVVP